MSNEQLTFKVIFNQEIRRFVLPAPVSWYNFVSTLETQIFKGNAQYHRELHLQYIDSDGDRITVSSEIEWQAALQYFASTEIKKFEIVEGNNSIFFKDSPPPEPLFFSFPGNKIAGNYETMINSEGLVTRYSDLMISLDGTVQLGTYTLSGCVFDHRNNKLTWSNDVNESEADVTFSFENDQKITFSGNLLLKEFGDCLFTGTWKEKATATIEQQELDELAVAVPSCLASLFPGGKILPYHLPPFLEDSIKVIPIFDEEGNRTTDVDLDIDIGALHTTLSREAVKRLDEKQFEEAKKFLTAGLNIRPNNPVDLYNFACAEALSGDSQQALHYLREAHKNGYTNWCHMISDPDLSSLAGSDEFVQLVESMEGHI